MRIRTADLNLPSRSSNIVHFPIANRASGRAFDHVEVEESKRHGSACCRMRGPIWFDHKLAGCVRIHNGKLIIVRDPAAAALDNGSRVRSDGAILAVSRAGDDRCLLSLESIDWPRGG